MTRQRAAVRLRQVWGSIRWRAVLLTSVAVAVVLAVFIWYTVRTVDRSLAQSGGARAEATALILALQVSQSSQSGVNRLQEAALSPAIRAYVLAPSPVSERDAIERLRRVSTTGQEGVFEIWDPHGKRLLDLVDPPGAATGFPADAAPSQAGLRPLQVSNGRLLSASVVGIPSDPDHPAASPSLGFLAVRRWVRLSSQNALTGIVGTGATILIGNQSGMVWTDLERIVDAPAFDTTRPGPHEFPGSGGEPLIGAAAPIPGTPWLIVTELRRDAVVAPAWQLLRRLSGAGLAFLVVATLAAAVLSRQVTRPLEELTHAAQTIARGDYSWRVGERQGGDVGQLATAFNTMADRIEQGRAALEARAADLDASRAAADRANRVKDQFLAVLSHELRTPLNAMLGWCQMLRLGHVPSEKTPHAIEVIERNALAQLRLVEDLLDVSRMVAGKFTVDLQPTNPAAVVQAAVESILPVAGSKRIHIATTVAADSGSVLADAGRLQQAVWNLLANAIKFTPDGGRVDVVMRRSGAAIEIVVRDDGRGIDPGDLPHIFDRFREGTGNWEQRPSGLGLGLAIVRQIVELHKGTIQAESAGPGAGAVFRLVLPAFDAPTGGTRRPAVLDSAGAGVVPSLRGIRVLAVEDDQDARELLADLLTRQGAAVAAVANAPAARSWLDEHRVDVLVSDIEMPEQDGHALVKWIRSAPDERTRRLPAIALTAYGADEDRARSSTAGFDRHLVKPVDFAELLTAIRELVAGGAGETPRPRPSPSSRPSSEAVG